MSQVDGEDRAAGDHIDLIRLDADSADGRDGGSAEGPGDRFDRLNHYGGAGERVTPQNHGRRTGMIGTACDDDFEMCTARDRADDGKRLARCLEYGALLDVQLDERVDVVARGRADLGWVGPSLMHRLRNCAAIGIDVRAGLSR